MKKRIGIVLLALLAAAGLRVQAQERMVGEEVVAIVGGTMILLSDVMEARDMIEQQQRQQGYTTNREALCEALEALMLRHTLANQARIDSLDPDTSYVDMEIENHLDQLVEQYGSLLTLEAVYRKPIYQIRDDLREQYLDMQLANEMEMTIKSDVSVVPSEVERFYRRTSADSLPMLPEQYEYAQIVMYPPSLEEAKLRTRERLLDFRQRVIDGTDFGTLARLYSVDPGSNTRGGEYDFMEVIGLQRPFGEALEKLREGQISPVVETDDGFHIIQMLERRGNKYRFRHILLKPEYTQEELVQTAVKLDSVANLIKSGELSFEEAALLYSEDKYTKFNGGVASNRELVEMGYGNGARSISTRFAREELGNDYSTIRGMSPGDVSGSYITYDLRGNQQVKLVKLIDIVPPHRANIKDDYGLIEDLALYAKREEIYNAWLKKTIGSMYIRIDPRFQACDFEQEGWIK